LKQKGRNLFERGQLDEFIIESLELGKKYLLLFFLLLFIFNKISLKIGELTKLHIEHDNSGFLGNADWFLDKVEVINMETNDTIVFPCDRWLGRKHDDHEIQRDLLPLHAS
jgi:hypothetical protein